MNKLNVAVIGIGNMGKFHVNTYSDLEEANLVAIADLDEELGKKMAEKYKCNYYKDYKEMIDREKVDIISIAVPTIYHKEIALYCIKKNINILIEKPIADTIENALEIINEAKKSEVKVSVGHIERFNPAILKLKEIIDSGRLGKISSIIARRVGVCPPQIKDADVLVDLAVHDIDIINNLVKEVPQSIQINSGKAILSNRNDYADVFLSYKDVSALVQVNWITPVKIRKLNITGNKGYLELDYISQEITLYESNYTKEVSDFGEFIIKFGSPNKIEIGVEKDQPLKKELQSFIDCVKNNKNPEVTLEEAIEALKIALNQKEKKEMKKKVLLIGCGGSAGYNFVESLKMSEEEFIIVGTDINKEHLELSNCDVKYLVPKNSDPSYIDVINKIIEKEKIDFFHIQPDVEVAFWSENRDKIKAKYLLPSKESIKLCHDKMEFNKILEDKKIPVPKSCHINSKEDIKKYFELLKNSSEKIWVRAIRGAGSRASLPITEVEHAEMWIDYWNKNKGTNYSDFMLAEYLPGKEFAFQSIWKNGELITSQARERKEYVFGSLMPSGQSSSPSVALSVHDERVNKIATDAILAIDEKPEGIYCVDMKENKEGIPCVTEINIGRFFTTSDFFTKAGSNMPYFFVKLGLNEEIPLLSKYNAIPENLYWLRVIDMGKKMVKEKEWTFQKI